jgi:hypothetical protein
MEKDLRRASNIHIVTTDMTHTACARALAYSPVRALSGPRVYLEDGAEIASVVIVVARVNQSNDLIAGLIAIFWSRTVGGVFYENYKV